MSHRGRWCMVVVAVLALASSAWAPAWAARVVLPRPGQIGVGAQGGYGALLKSGEFGNAFSNGPTLAIRLRYRMRYERAIGLSFENERFEIRVPEAEYPAGTGFAGRLRANAILSGLELYQMFGTRTQTAKMIMAGVGLAQTSGRDAIGDTFYPGDGAYVSLGAGVERFVYRSWALDLSTRYVALFLPDDRSHDIQVALGFMFYASY